MDTKSDRDRLLVLATTVAFAGAQDYQIVKVPSVAGAAIDKLKPKTIFFNDHRVDETSDKGAFIRFDEWSAHPADRSGSSSTCSRASRKAWSTGSSTARRKR